MTSILALLGIGIFTSISYLFWYLARFDWLSKICILLVISLPFERIPSMSLGGANLRFSQILIVFGLWIFGVLLVRRDSLLINQKIHRFNYFLFAFILFSIPSWFYITDIKRFLVTEIGTLLVFGGFFLLSQFTTNLANRLKDLITTMFFVTLFGFYQFIGDMIGLPSYLTGLRETYTKIVFGVPRIHATAIEPLYFAGMLFICLFLSLSYFFLNKPTLNNQFLSYFKLENTSNYVINASLFSFFLFAFLLTISKSAIVIFFSMLPFFGFFLIKIFKVDLLAFLKKTSTTLSIGILLIFGAYIYNPSFQTIFTGIYDNFVSTINGDSASSGERSAFLRAFDQIIDDHLVLGISSGHFGVEAGNYIPFQTGTDNYLIVNNVYLEVWLEHGLIPAVIFIIFILMLLLYLIGSLIKGISRDKEQSCIKLSLFFTLLAYCFQWMTFSPIFIMPIFIILGLIASYINSEEKVSV